MVFYQYHDGDENNIATVNSELYAFDSNRHREAISYSASETTHMLRGPTQR